jgi:hypothetical protein
MISEASIRANGIGWIKITWDMPVTQDHADAALLAAISPARTSSPAIARLIEAVPPRC